MITIQKAQANNLVFTLTEKTTIAPAFYFLELFSNQNHDSKVVYLGTDISTSPERWNEFEVTENDTEDLPNSVVSLEPTTYDYFVWESTSTDFADKVSRVESGKCVVNGEATPTGTFTDKP
jgi:hypothetical protein